MTRAEKYMLAFAAAVTLLIAVLMVFLYIFQVGIGDDMVVQVPGLDGSAAEISTAVPTREDLRR